MFLTLAVGLVIACGSGGVENQPSPAPTTPPEELKPSDVVRVIAYADAPARTHACVELVEFMVPVGSPVANSRVSECTIRDLFEPGWVHFTAPDNSGVRQLAFLNVIIFFTQDPAAGAPTAQKTCMEVSQASLLYPVSAQPRPVENDVVWRGFCATLPPLRGVPGQGTAEALAPVRLMPGQAVADGVPCWTLVKYYLNFRPEGLPSTTVRCTLN